MSGPPKCPYLPTPEVKMSHTCLTNLRDAEASIFYYKALQYGHYLWLNGHAGRAILAITRALYADVSDKDSILKDWPLPYAALRWIIENHVSNDFPGNPRISFQHQATRLRGDRQALRRARAWAVWAIIRKARPQLEGDSNQAIEEPSVTEIHAQLSTLGSSGEAKRWHSVLSGD